MLESSGIEGSRIKKTPGNATSRIAEPKCFAASGAMWQLLWRRILIDKPLHAQRSAIRTSADTETLTHYVVNPTALGSPSILREPIGGKSVAEGFGAPQWSIAGSGITVHTQGWVRGVKSVGTYV